MQRININFYLEKRSNTTTDVPINMDLTFPGGRIRMYSGFRISPEKWDAVSGGFLRYYPQKTFNDTRILVRVPLPSEVLKIIQKYQYVTDRLLPRISVQRYNDYLKILFSHLRLNRPVLVVDPKTQAIETKPLSEVVTSHVGRKTFVACLHNSVKNEVIQAMTGHIEGSKAFNRYFSVTDEELKTAISDL